MDILISTAELRSALHRVQGIVEAKNSMPILACVHLSAEITPAGGRLTIKATDLEIGCMTSHPCEVKKAGTLAIQAKALHDVAKALPETSCRIKVAANNRAEITSGASSFRLAGLAADDYPALAEAKELEFYEFDRQALRDGLDRVVHAMSDDATRYNLNGVFFDFAKGGLSLVATDGHRLSACQLETFPQALKAGVIVSRKAVNELRKLLSEETSAPGKIAANDNTVAYMRSGLIFTSRLVDGSFPDYTQVIPKYEADGVVVPRGAMIDLLKRVLLLASDHASAVNLELKESELTVTTRNPDVGDATDTLAVEYAGKPFAVTLNGRYLLDTLMASPSPKVQVQFDDDLSPILAKPVEGSMMSVLMPMRR